MNDRRACQLGLWSAAFTACLAVAYLALLIGYFATQGFVFPPSEFVQLGAGVITLLTVPALVVLFCALRPFPARMGSWGLSASASPSCSRPL